MWQLWLRFWDNVFGRIRCVDCGAAEWFEEAWGWRFLGGAWRCHGCVKRYQGEHLGRILL
jgi:hypothetical protein